MSSVKTDNSPGENDSSLDFPIDDIDGVQSNRNLSVKNKECCSVQSLSSTDDQEESCSCACDNSSSPKQQQQPHLDENISMVPPIQIPTSSNREGLLSRGNSLTGGVHLSVSPSSPPMLDTSSRPNPGFLNCRRCSTPAGGRRTVCVLDCRYCRYVSEGMVSPSLMSPRASLYSTSLFMCNRKSSPLLSPTTASPSQSEFF